MMFRSDNVDTIKRENMLKAIRDFKTVDKELISSYQEGYIGKNVIVCGWIKAIRKSKNICFIE